MSRSLQLKNVRKNTLYSIISSSNMLSALSSQKTRKEYVYILMKFPYGREIN